MHYFSNGSENIVGIDSKFTSLLESVGEEVEEELRVGGSVDVSMGVVVEVVLEMSVVGEVTILFGQS